MIIGSKLLCEYRHTGYSSYLLSTCSRRLLNLHILSSDILAQFQAQGYSLRQCSLADLLVMRSKMVNQVHLSRVDDVLALMQIWSDGGVHVVYSIAAIIKQNRLREEHQDKEDQSDHAAQAARDRCEGWLLVEC